MAQCLICSIKLSQDPITLASESNTSCALECGHVFHKTCILEHYNFHEDQRRPGLEKDVFPKCPVCRTPFVFDMVRPLYLNGDDQEAIELRKAKSDLDSLTSAFTDLTVKYLAKAEEKVESRCCCAWKKSHGCNCVMCSFKCNNSSPDGK